MEITSRDSIAHKIRDRDAGEPPTATIPDELSKKVFDLITSPGVQKLSRIYHLVDEIMKAQEHTIVCRRGCSYCCKVDADIFNIEAEYISKNTGKTLHNIEYEPDTYCPLMDKQTGECTVYSFRPFVCRTFAAYDSPDYCRDGEKHWTNGGPSNGYGSQSLLHLSISVAEIQAGLKLDEHNYPSHKERLQESARDIRSYFK